MFSLKNFRRHFLGAAAAPYAHKDWRAIVDHLLADGRLAASDYLRALGAGPGPARWALPLFLFFGAAQIVAAVIFFFAYNWRDLPDAAKIALPQIVMIAGLLGWAILPARSPASVIAGVLATVMIGVSMAIVGQTYQLGADPWRLFVIWTAFALPLSLLARSDAHFTVWAAIATAAYVLFADQVLEPQTTFDDEFFWRVAMAVYATAIFALLLARDFVIGAMPSWQRWLFTAVACFAVLPGALNELFSQSMFSDGVLGAGAQLSVAGAVFAIYAYVRPDRPARALALFAIAVWVASLGVRILFETDPDDYSLIFTLSALWIVAVTTGFAWAVRNLGRASSEGRAP